MVVASKERLGIGTAETRVSIVILQITSSEFWRYKKTTTARFASLSVGQKYFMGFPAKFKRADREL